MIGEEVRFLKHHSSKYLSYNYFKYENKKTLDVVVLSKKADFLGVIKWYAPWRKYVFFPEKEIILDSICLSCITKTIKTLMREHKK